MDGNQLLYETYPLLFLYDCKLINPPQNRTGTSRDMWWARMVLLPSDLDYFPRSLHIYKNKMRLLFSKKHISEKKKLL
jgi:hypothetical protein